MSSSSVTKTCTVCSAPFNSSDVLEPRPDLNRLLCLTLDLHLKTSDPHYFSRCLPFCDECKDRLKNFANLKLALENTRHDVVTLLSDTLLHVSPDSCPLQGILGDIQKRWPQVQLRTEYPDSEILALVPIDNVDNSVECQMADVKVTSECERSTGNKVKDVESFPINDSQTYQPNQKQGDAVKSTVPTTEDMSIDMDEVAFNCTPNMFACSMDEDIIPESPPVYRSRVHGAISLVKSLIRSPNEGKNSRHYANSSKNMKKVDNPVRLKVESPVIIKVETPVRIKVEAKQFSSPPKCVSPTQDRFADTENYLSPVLPRPGESSSHSANLENSPPFRVRNCDNENNRNSSPVTQTRTRPRNLMQECFEKIKTSENITNEVQFVSVTPAKFIPPPAPAPTSNKFANRVTVPKAEAKVKTKPKQPFQIVLTDRKYAKQGRMFITHDKDAEQKKLKQTTLTDMKKSFAAKSSKYDEYDITTLDTFQGGVRLCKGKINVETIDLDETRFDPSTTTSNVQKRKSDELYETENLLPRPETQTQDPFQDDLDMTVFEATEAEAIVAAPSKIMPVRKREKLGEHTMKLIDEFDEMPVRNDFKEPGFAYKPDKAVRKKEERAKLPGWSCDECRKWYGSSQNVPAHVIAEQINKCSKHRAKYINMESTPPGYWDVNFPSTLELHEQGHIIVAASREDVEDH